MSSADSTRAVFLSYASQDAEAARRICEALRAAGVEVWFDQNELVGGDAWDAKIRKQIAECALFVPVISASSQARLEGYFRIEWKLAARRTHAMATAKAFLLPVVIDSTRDADAHVPDEFREVQWTRLAGGEVPEKFCGRVQRLLEGNAALQPVPEPLEREPKQPATSKPSRPWLVPAVLVLALAVALLLWRPWSRQPSATKSGDAVSLGAKPGRKTEADTAANLTARAFEHYYPFCTTGRLQLADEFSRRATDLDPNYAPAWGARAGASARYLLRDWVSGEAARQRARDAQSFANRALSLDKNETEALLALGIVAWHQKAAGQAETLFRRVMTVDPANVQAPTLLSRVAREGGRAAEAVELMKKAVERAPRDPMVRLYAGFAYFDGWNFPKAAEQFEAASRVADFQGAWAYKAWADFFQNGDLARLRAELGKLDLVYAEDDGKLAMNLVCALYERRSDRVVETAGRSASAYIDDWWTPKAWFTALAYEIEHKENLARQQWQAAEAVVRERLKADPQDEVLRVNLAVTLAKLGRTRETRADFDAVEAAWREQITPIRALRLARFHAAAAEPAKAVEWLRLCVNRPTFLDENVTPRTLVLDPWWDGIRGSEEFRTLLAKPPAPPTPVDEAAAVRSTAVSDNASEKSVAVLAFANLSDDKANEYFSDGISEELLNVLAKVPGLKVSARTSAFSFKGKNVPMPEIGRQLGVAYVVEGSVRKAGSQVRITAQLIKAADGFQVWSDTFTRELKDVFAMQDEIAGLIAKQLQLTLGDAPRVTNSVNPEAHRLVLEGVHYWNLRTDDGFTRAEAAFRKAIELAPDLAQAHAGLANVLGTRAAYQAYAGLAMPSAEPQRAAAQRALALSPNLPEAYAGLSQSFFLEGRLAEAAREFRRGLALNPNSALLHHWYSLVLEIEGRLDEALTEIGRAIELDPLSGIALLTRERMLTGAGKYADALELHERVMGLLPGNETTFGFQALCLLKLNRPDEALAAARKIIALPSMTRRITVDAQAIFVLRQTGHAAEIAEHAQRILPLFTPDSYQRGAVLATQGRWEEARPYLERTPVILHYVFYWDLIWDAWREDPRFQQLMGKLGCAEEYKVARETQVRMMKEQAAKK